VVDGDEDSPGNLPLTKRKEAGGRFENQAIKESRDEGISYVLYTWTQVRGESSFGEIKGPEGR